MTLAVSATLSPLAADELELSEKPMTWPPSSYMAASKLSLVLVDGSKKRVASFFPSHLWAYASGLAMMSMAVWMRLSSSSAVKSSMLMRFLMFYFSFIQLSSDGSFLRAMSLSMSSGLIYPSSAAT